MCVITYLHRKPRGRDILWPLKISGVKSNARFQQDDCLFIWPEKVQEIFEKLLIRHIALNDKASHVLSVKNG